MERFGDLVREAGGADAPDRALGRLRIALAAELERGEDELGRSRSGYDGRPVVAGIAAAGAGTAVVLPVTARLAADIDAAPERAALLTIAAAGALVAAGGRDVACGEQGGRLLLASDGADAELTAVAFDELVEGMDRLRAQAVVLPAGLLASEGPLRPPVGATHRLRIAVAVARAGGDPVHPTPEEVDAALLLLQPDDGGAVRPHRDPDPARRVARRILQRLDGMGKWGGYHTEFVHLSRGFAGNDRALAEAVGEALVEGGLLVEKPSVGQRHVSLNPRRTPEIHALLDRGEVPPGLTLPAPPG